MAERENASVSRVSSQESQESESKEKKDSGSDSEKDDKKKDKKSSDKKDKKSGDSEKSDDEKKKFGKDKDKSKDGKDGGEDEKKSGLAKKEEQLKQKAELMKKLQTISAAAQTAMAATKMFMAMKLLMWLKMMAQMALAIAQAAIQMGFWGFMGMVMQAAGQAIVNGLAALAGFFGTAVSTIVTGVVALVVVVAVGVGTVVVDFLSATAQRDSLTDCNNDISWMESSGQVSEDMEAAAKHIYGFYKALGLPDENIAGILGNWQSESQLDSSGVETIYTEPFQIPVEGMKKYEAWKGSYLSEGTLVSPVGFMYKDSTNQYGLISMPDTALRSGTVWSNYNLFSSYAGPCYIGIGLGQWTNGRTIKLLEYAEAHPGYEWYDMDLQLMFSIDTNKGDNIWNVEYILGWEAEATPTSAAQYFCQRWEGIPWQEQRGTQAEYWFSQMATWQEGVDYDLSSMQALIAAVGAAGASGADSAGSSALRSCSGVVRSNNSSAAAAAVSYAWGPGEAYNNDGTACWKHIFETVLEGSYPIRSCDRTVCAAIRWSGTDTDYPVGGTYDQAVYLNTSPRWMEVTNWGGDVNRLMPGDVLIYNDQYYTGTRNKGHTVMYVGVDAVVAKFGETYNGHDVRAENYCIVSGSIGDYSPHVGKFYNGVGVDGLNNYHVFRNIQKYSNNSTYTSATCVS